MIRVGTRRSALALAQAELVAGRLRALGAEVAIVSMRTEGDRLFDMELARLGGKGLFVREIEQALLEGAVDLAVHSLKDLPADVPEGLCLAAFPERDDPRDVLIARVGHDLDQIPSGSVVGTSSPRRRALLRAARPDLTVAPLRGNVDTRLRKLQDGAVDAVILAAAGLRRLGLWPETARPLSPEAFVPAIGQGVLALETRRRDGATRRVVEGLDDPATRVCALAERAFLGRLGASCASPLAAHARVEGGVLRMQALIASEDGCQVLRADGSGAAADAEPIGRRLAEALLERGAATMVPLEPSRHAGGGDG